MAHWAISDVHGCHSQLMSLLDRIGFSPSDELYLVGDMLDRGSENAEMADWLVNGAGTNVHVMLGNHEHMMLTESDPADMSIIPDASWTYNSGDETARQLLRLPVETREDLYEMYRTADAWTTVDVGGEDPRRVLLVHAGPYVDADVVAECGGSVERMCSAESAFTLVWERESWLTGGWDPDIEVVFGHTPVMLAVREIVGSGRTGSVMPDAATLARGMRWHVMRWGNKTDIDCGCAYGGNLAAYRLEDHAEVYVPGPAAR